MLVGIANREDHDQTVSLYLGLHYLSRHCCQASSVRNFRTLTIYSSTYLFVDNSI